MDNRLSEDTAPHLRHPVSMTDLVYLHGFSSGPGGNKGRFARQWAEARGIAYHAPDLNLPSFETLTLTAQVAAVRPCSRPCPARRCWWAVPWVGSWPPLWPTGARPWRP